MTLWSAVGPETIIEKELCCAFEEIPISRCFFPERVFGYAEMGSSSDTQAQIYSAHRGRPTMKPEHKQFNQSNTERTLDFHTNIENHR